MRLPSSSRHLLPVSFLVAPVLSSSISGASSGWAFPPSGNASSSHYDLPLNFTAACGCAQVASYYPVAALSRLAFGSDNSYGPGCGQCFNISLQEPADTSPPFILPVDQRPWIVIKVVDECPGKTYCSATPKKQNAVGRTVHFDIAAPSPSIPLSFYPSNQSEYGYTDFGIWYVHYESVSCDTWSGWNNASALGLEPSLPPNSTVCCPSDPIMTNSTCPPSPPNSAATTALPPSSLLSIVLGTALLVLAFASL